MKATAKWMFLGALSLLLTPDALAQATRTWVSGVGDDVNPCSRTAPCKTFAGAISKTAAGGEISVLDPGGYGAVTITKSITLNGEGTLASILVSGTPAIIVSAQPTDVVIIRNLSIQGAGTGTFGIRFFTGGELHVENTAILNFSDHALYFNPSGDSRLYVSNSSFRNNTGGGVLVSPTGSGSAMATLNTVVMDGNGRGLRAEDRSTVIVRDSVATGNLANGFVAFGSTVGVDLTLENCAASNNGATGVYAGTLATVKLSNTAITKNHDGIQMVGGTTVSFGNNRIRDNQFNNGPPTSNIGQQ